MADEITVLARLSYSKSGSSDSLPDSPAPISVTLTGTRCLKHRQSVATSEEALVLGETTAGGYCLIINRDATNFVSVRAATGATALIKIKAGEIALFRLSSAAPFVIADTAAVEIEYLLLSN